MSVTPIDIVLPGLFLVVFTSTGLLLTQSSIWSVSFLAIQYVGVFILVATEWPFAMAFSKLIAGWIGTTVLGMAILTFQQESAELGSDESRFRWLSKITLAYGETISALLFRLFAAILVGLVVISVIPNVTSWVPGIATKPALGGLFLIGLGLLHLGLTTHPLRVIVGLLTIFSGFEVLYAAVEESALVAGLLAAITLSLSLLGAYFLLLPVMGEEE